MTFNASQRILRPMMRSWPRCNLDGGYTVPAIFDSVDNVQKFRARVQISLKLVILR